MLTNNELWNKCGTDEIITREDLGIPYWMSDTDGIIRENIHGIFYKTSEGFRDSKGKLLNRFKVWWYGLE